MLALLERMFDGTLAENRQLAAGRGNHDIGIDQHLRYVCQQHRLGAEAVGQLAGPSQGAVGHHHLGDAGLGQVPGDQVNGLTRPHQQRAGVGQVGEDMPRQVDRGIGDRHRVFTDGRVGAHPLGDREHPWEKPHKLRPHGARLLGYRIGGLELAKDLRFTQHHGIQAAGDLDHVLQGVLTEELVAAVANHFRIEVVVVGQPLQGVLHGHLGVGLLGKKQLGAITGGKNDQLIGLQAIAALLQGFHKLLWRERHPLTQVQRRRIVVDAQGCQLHNYRQLTESGRNLPARRGRDSSRLGRPLQGAAPGRLPPVVGTAGRLCHY